MLAAWELGLRYGHLANIVPVARVLAKTGHKVTLAARDIVTASLVPATPFDTVFQAPLYLRGGAPKRPCHNYAQVIAAAGFDDGPALQALVAAWLAIIDRLQPKALIAEHAPVALLAAHIAGIPALRLGTSFMAPPVSRPMASLTPWAPSTPAELQVADAPVDALIARTCAHFGAPALAGLADLLESATDFLTTWPELDHYGPRADAHYYGPMDGFGGMARPDWPDAVGPKLFVYLPDEHPGFAALMAALATLGWPTIMHSQYTPQGRLPANVRFTADPVDMTAVLSEASIFAGRVGHGSCAQAMRAGCRQLLMPDTLETSLLAYRIAKAGLGLVPADLDVGLLQRCLVTLATDERIAARVEQSRMRYARYDPEAAAAELAQDILATVGPA